MCDNEESTFTYTIQVEDFFLCWKDFKIKQQSINLKFKKKH
jgi:hypothetical protein